METQKERINSIRGYEKEWLEAVKIIGSRNIKSLLVKCPQCNKYGTLISKWVAKVPIKPLYVIHTNGKNDIEACLLSPAEASSVRSDVFISYNDILKLIRVGRPYILFSGGKDSLCTLEYIRRIATSLGKEVTAVHADTTAGFPEIKNYVKNVCNKLGITLKIVRPPHDYFDLAKRWGIPGVKSRWCCETLKIAPMRRFFSSLDGPKIVFDGIRAAESALRATYIPVWYHPSFRCISVSPIFNWSNEKVKNYIERKNLPKSPMADLGTSAECWCGAYKCRRDFMALLRTHPEIFNKLIEVEEAQRGKYTFLFEKGRQVSLQSLKETEK